MSSNGSVKTFFFFYLLLFIIWRTFQFVIVDVSINKRYNRFANDWLTKHTKKWGFKYYLWIFRIAFKSPFIYNIKEIVRFGLPLNFILIISTILFFLSKVTEDAIWNMVMVALWRTKVRIGKLNVWTIEWNKSIQCSISMWKWIKQIYLAVFHRVWWVEIMWDLFPMEICFQQCHPLVDFWYPQILTKW